MRAFRHVSRPHEVEQVNSSTWYATALALLTLTLEPTVMIIGVLVLAFADPAAAIIGRRFGRISLINGRTVEGSLTFALVGAVAFNQPPKLIRLRMLIGKRGGLDEALKIAES